MTLRGGWWIACVVALLGPFAAQAQPRAWLDRDRIELGETATLNVETDQADAQPPDYSALLPDFVLSGHSSRRSYALAGGQRRARTLFGVALAPRREGVVTIPALRVGNQRTSPLTLTVLPASAPPPQAGAPAFIESEIDSAQPYVQQSMALVLRLHYATPLVSGTLDQPVPDGASMQRIGSDLQYTRDVGGRRYTVIERRYQIVPERSGPLTLPGARFQGRGVGGFFDDLFGGGQRDLRAHVRPRTLQVLPVPEGAPQPWLPLHGLELRYASVPQTVRAGEAATVEVEAVADGAVAAQLPGLELAVGAGAQVFAEPPRIDESFGSGRLHTRVTRRFSVVPARDGPLHVPGPRMAWWDVSAGIARTASLPDLQWQVLANEAAGDSAVVAQGRSAGAAALRPHDRSAWWPAMAVLFAVLWLATLGWAVRIRGARRPAVQGAAAAAPIAGQPAMSTRQWRQVLQAGDLADVATALCAMATPPAGDLDALQARLGDAAQREAVASLQRARWGGGDPAAARAALAAAFARAPVWRVAAPRSDEVLAPLYPPSRAQ